MFKWKWNRGNFVACMEFVLFEIFSVLLLVVKDGDVFTTGGHFRGVDMQLLKYL